MLSNLIYDFLKNISEYKELKCDINLDLENGVVSIKSPILNSEEFDFFIWLLKLCYKEEIKNIIKNFYLKRKLIVGKEGLIETYLEELSIESLYNNFLNL